jgi:hypothetical protein
MPMRPTSRQGDGMHCCPWLSGTVLHVHILLVDVFANGSFNKRTLPMDY